MSYYFVLFFFFLQNCFSLNHAEFYVEPKVKTIFYIMGLCVMEFYEFRNLYRSVYTGIIMRICLISVRLYRGISCENINLFTKYVFLFKNNTYLKTSNSYVYFIPK